MAQSEELGFAELFCNRLYAHAERKAKLYDGIQRTRVNTHEYVTIMTEELGEVASALIRERIPNVIAECLDLAHTAMLMVYRLDPNGDLLRHMDTFTKDMILE